MRTSAGLALDFHEARSFSNVRSKPLCVDLDGTLVMTDTLWETALTVGITGLVSAAIAQLRKPGRAALKREIAIRADISPAAFPYNTDLIAYLTEAKRTGRTLVLVTAADELIARAVASHLGLFDEVIASDGTRNLKGAEKARELVRRFGSGGFDYVANGGADIAVWDEADNAILVNAPNWIARRLRSEGRTTVELSSQPPRLKALVRALRPHQWVKNLLVFVPLLASHDIGNLPGLLGALLVFAALCATASAIYLVNDIVDLNADRKHPRKSRRPFASGSLPLAYGFAFAALLFTVGFTVAAFANSLLVVGAYAAMSMGYSFYFKRYPLLDVFVLAALYTLRILAGGIASDHPVSLWLLAFSGYTFLSLALVKRCAEVSNERPADQLHQKVARRGYYQADRALLVMFGIGATFASSVVLALFIGSTGALERYGSPQLLWILVPLILLWQCRLWLATERGHMHDDPIIYSSRDWVSWFVAATSAVTVVTASVIRLPL